MVITPEPNGELEEGLVAGRDIRLFDAAQHSHIMEMYQLKQVILGSGELTTQTFYF